MLYLHRPLQRKQAWHSGEIEDGRKETFLSIQGDIPGLGISSAVGRGGESFFSVGQFSLSKFLVRNCAGNVFRFFPKFRQNHEALEGSVP